MGKQKSTKNKAPAKLIASNKKAFHDYFIEQRFEAGLALEGWEVKSLRAGRAQLKESYIVLKGGEVWLIGAHISPLSNVPAHLKPDPVRTRKLLLHHKEINKLMAAKDREGYTIVALDLHWTRNRAKADIALVKGKKLHDKRETTKQREWEREKHRILKR